ASPWALRPAETGGHQPLSRRGRRRPTIPAFPPASAASRGWSAFADHDVSSAVVKVDVPPILLRRPRRLLHPLCQAEEPPSSTTTTHDPAASSTIRDAFS